VRWAISCLKRGKASEVDMVTAKEIIATGENGVDVMFALCSKIWTEERIPEEWKQSIIVPIYKKKDKLVCDNYRGISLLCHAEKLLATIVLQRIKSRTEEILSEAQGGFRSGRSTIDQLMSLRLITEKYQEYNKDLYVCYVDFQKAFDSVWRRGLWQTMRHLGYDRKVIQLLESLYKTTKSAVRVGTKGELSNWFETLVGVLQECVLSPLLFNILLEVVMALADVEESGILVSGDRISTCVLQMI
jgi:Reverse transcriptase (RNA-dependent DNA polymerase)